VEPIFLGSFPSYAASTTKTFPLTGTVPEGFEVLALEIIFELTLKSSAAAFALAVADHNTIGAALINKMRATLWGVVDAVNLTFTELRTLAIYATGRDPAPQDPAIRSGVAGGVPISSGAAAAMKLKLVIPFYHHGLDNPEVIAPSAEQVSLPGSKLDMDTLGTGLAALVLTNGTAVVTVSDVKVYALVQPSDGMVHVGPPHLMRTRTVNLNLDQEQGKGWDLLVADERSPATVEGQVAQFTVTRDGKPIHRNISPTTLAQMFGEAQPAADGVFGVDLTNNSLGGTGAVITPIVYVGGRIRETEWKWKVFGKSRTIFQNLAAGGSPAATYLFWQVRPMDDQQPQQQIGQLLGGKAHSLDALPIRGGGGPDNDLNGMFKGRYLPK
jgi:hypothetical protein